jgi:hypothetical protein
MPLVHAQVQGLARDIPSSINHRAGLFRSEDDDTIKADKAVQPKYTTKIDDTLRNASDRLTVIRIVGFGRFSPSIAS